MLKVLIGCLMLVAIVRGEEECDSWSKWSACTKICNGKDTKSRSRSCFDEETGLGHDSTQRARCYSPDCIEWSTWSSWSNCNAQRERQCRLKGTNTIVKGCSGETIQKERCNECKAIWTDWSPWGGCSASCGTSHQSRKRVCVLKYTVHPSDKCVGQSTEVKVCTRPACPTWSKWTDWSGCSKTCGSDSIRSRSRQCIFDGKPISSTSCSGASSETVNCNKAGCPVWTSWGSWGSCSATCGSDIHRSRNRQCVIAGTNQRTTGCPGSLTNVGKCNWLKGCPVWTSWGAWGPCSASCGLTGVTRTRLRQCVYQGTTTHTTGCPGLTSNVAPCSAKLCPCDCLPEHSKPKQICIVSRGGKLLVGSECEFREWVCRSTIKIRKMTYQQCKDINVPWY